MGRNIEVLCDYCNKDLTYTGNSVDYRLVLSPEHIPSRGSLVTDMMIYPPVDREYYFCGMPCLKAWLEHGTPQHDPGAD